MNTQASALQADTLKYSISIDWGRHHYTEEAEERHSAPQLKFQILHLAIHTNIGIGED